MTRRYWAGVMFASLLIMGGAGYFVYTRLMEKSTKTVELHPVLPIYENKEPTGSLSQEKNPSSKQTEIPTDEVEKNRLPITESAEIPAKADQAAPQKSQEIKPKSPSSSDLSETRNILFKIVSSSAKEIFVVGDFNNWYRQKMDKNGTTFSVSIPIKPGKYEYKYIVDDRRINDPYNKDVSKNGHSQLVVDPL